LGLVLHPLRDLVEALDVVSRWAASAGFTLTGVDDERLPETVERHADADLAAECDLVLALGGDATMLAAMRLAAPHGVPVLGANLGRVGYLTEVDEDRLVEALDALAAGSFAVEKRFALCAQWREDGAHDDARRRRQTSKPSSVGSLRSSTTRSGRHSAPVKTGERRCTDDWVGSAVGTRHRDGARAVCEAISWKRRRGRRDHAGRRSRWWRRSRSDAGRNHRAAGRVTHDGRALSLGRGRCSWGRACAGGQCRRRERRRRHEPPVAPVRPVLPARSGASLAHAGSVSRRTGKDLGRP
jgi:hypothetical protein